MLNNRLNTILKLLDNGDVLLDIGADHALLDIQAVKCGIVSKAIASDISIPTVNKAKLAINNAMLSNHITTICSDGFDNINEHFDQVCISGMGAPLIIDILSRGIGKIHLGTTLIIQPQNEYDLLRRWLYNNGFDIIEEHLTEDKNHIYIVFKCVKIKNRVQYNIKDVLIGKCLKFDEFKYYQQYLEFILNYRKKSLEQMQKAKDKERRIYDKTIAQTINDLQEEIELIIKQIGG